MNTTKPFVTAPLKDILDKSSKCPKCGYYTPKPQPTEAQIEAATQAIAPLWHKFCTEQAEVLVDGKNHISFIQELAVAALQAAGDV